MDEDEKWLDDAYDVGKRRGYNSGLLRAARRASAMAGTRPCLCGEWVNGRPGYRQGMCPKHALLTLAAKLREEANEPSQ